MKLWFIRLLGKRITQEKAQELGLEFHRNLFGDEVNAWDCRSLWTDKKGFIYRVKSLYGER